MTKFKMIQKSYLIGVSSLNPACFIISSISSWVMTSPMLAKMYFNSAPGSVPEPYIFNFFLISLMNSTELVILFTISIKYFKCFN